MIALIDTNVLVRFLTGDKSPKYSKLYNFFNSLEKGEIQVELKLIILFQTIFVLQSFYKVPKGLIADRLCDLLEFKGLRIKNKKKALRMLSLWEKTKLEIVDCYLVASLEDDKQNLLYSYDRDFDRFSIDRREP